MSAPTAADVLVLERPDARRLAEAFRELPKKGTLRLLCDRAQLADTLRGCEQAGFFAMQCRPAADSATVHLSAWKGKAGPCYETGRSATYRGSARAVLDDDHHFICGCIRVCEKTGGVYRLPPYAPYLEVSDADPLLLAKLETAPVPFNCDTFETDSAALLEKLAATRPSAAGAELQTVMYPGPFRLLVLTDGSLLRRGQPVGIPMALAAPLVASDGLLLLSPADTAPAPVAPSYQELYAARGAAGVLHDVNIQITDTTATADDDFNAAAFATCLPELLEQLRRMLARNAPYIVFSGSDPADPLGCCPSEQVGQANQLVAAGVLSKYAPPAPPGACTTSFFACAGEITVVDGAPQFSFNQPLRDTIACALGSPLTGH